MTTKYPRNLLTAAALVMACAWPWALAQAQTTSTVRIDPSDRRATWEGFGAGLSWWAHAAGGTPYQATYTNMFFGMAPVEFRTPTRTFTALGLGLNLVRYNVGGGGLPGDSPSGYRDQRPPLNVQPWHKDIDGYWRDWFSADPTSPSWDWTRDARQRAVLDTLRTQGVTVEFVSHAPMWWMMDSRSSAGGNLQAWNRRDHARHLATVAQQARTRWGVDVKSVTPFNEPLAGWWNYPVIQEGANIPIDVQAETLGYLREELNARGLADVTIAASDENTITQARAGYQGLLNRNVAVNGRTVSAASLVGKLNVHGYNGLEPWRDDAARRSLRRTVGDKRLWMTEYGDGEGSGLFLAQSIVADINQLGASGWLYWQPLEPYSAWGLVNGQYQAPADETSPTRAQPLWMYTKYHVFAQFTRFLRPGYKIIGSTDGRTVVAHDAVGRKLVLITLNEGPARTIRYDLSRFASVGTAAATVTTTTFDGARTMVPGTAALTGRMLDLAAPANAVQSTEISGVDLGPQAREIRSAASGQCVDVLYASAQAGSNLVQYDCAGVAHQRWFAVPSGTGYTLRASHTGQCMNVNGASTAAGAALIQWPCSGTTNALFDLRPQGQGHALVARHSGLCVGLQNGALTRDTRLTQQACTSAASQTWLLPLNSSTLQTTGNYLCLDMAGGTRQLGAEATQWDCQGTINQQWRTTAVGSDVQLSSATSGLCLGVAGSSLAAGAPVEQRNCLGSTEQRFERRAQGAGFALVARHSGLCLAPEDSSPVWGTRIVQQLCNGSDNQTWR
ncbi:MAG: RICIN domain-containing protein [Aquabacterium sp.]|nr:RICIN domain-containing protein [Aquabacterium sp.]